MARRKSGALKRLKAQSPFAKGRKSAEQTTVNKRKAREAAGFNPSLNLVKDKSRADLADVEFRMRLTFGI